VAEILEKFESNLRSQTNCYQKLVRLEKEKQQALVDNKIQEIEFITAQEEKILLEVSRLEEERLRWAEFFGKEIGKNVEEITLSDIGEVYPPIDIVHKELDVVFAELRELHRVNRELLENAVEIVSFTINSMTVEKKTTYSRPAERMNKNEKNYKLNIVDKSV
jgi:flagellar biosynthesis/type III secretory pathway chaperone